MERLTFEYDGIAAPGASSARSAVLVGVVSSGNLEVLIEPLAGDSRCLVELQTAARGFDAVWTAVLGDFVARSGLAGVRISINDVGATPAVVGLRLDQARETYLGVAP